MKLTWMTYLFRNAMAKYAHHKDTLIVLKDLENRMTQLIEANEKFRESHPELVNFQRMAIESCRTLVHQCKDNGRTFRGSDYVPDGLEQYFSTPSVTERLGK